MEPFELFEQNILEMLNHLYDPVYRPPEMLWRTLGTARESGIQALRDALMNGIEELKPAASVPPTARSWRIYGMLRHRFVEDLSQEASAERLGITARHLRRSFSEAIHALAMLLWEKAGGTLPSSFIEAESATGTPSAPAAGEEETRPKPALEPDASWQAQLARELEALEETATGAVSNVAETVSSALRLAGHLTAQRLINLSASPVTPGLMAAIHPSALRQILITVIDALARQMNGGDISITAQSQEGQVRISLNGSPLAARALDNIARIEEMLDTFHVSMQLSPMDDGCQVTLSILQVDRCVLVVDDNMDMAHLYRRYLSGTRYYLQHVSHGEKTFEAINQFHPDMVVLDVMLPDVDGWDLLTRLHENPQTRPLPVMVCSVMREMELARALGARHYLTKPVQRSDFIQALDAVLRPA